MINHLALNTPYFGILLSVIPFFLATILFEKQIVFSYSHRYLSVWYLVWPSSI